jgi:hypothetical protein
VEPGRRLRVAEPTPVRAVSTHRRGTTGQTGSAASKPRAVSSQRKPGSKPGSTTTKRAHSQAAKPAAHASASATHKPTSTKKNARQ